MKNLSPEKAELLTTIYPYFHKIVNEASGKEVYLVGMIHYNNDLLDIFKLAEAPLVWLKPEIIFLESLSVYTFEQCPKGYKKRIFEREQSEFSRVAISAKGHNIKFESLEGKHTTSTPIEEELKSEGKAVDKNAARSILFERVYYDIFMSLGVLSYKKQLSLLKTCKFPKNFGLSNKADLVKLFDIFKKAKPYGNFLEWFYLNPIYSREVDTSYFMQLLIKADLTAEENDILLKFAIVNAFFNFRFGGVKATEYARKYVKRQLRLLKKCAPPQRIHKEKLIAERQLRVFVNAERGDACVQGSRKFNPDVFERSKKMFEILQNATQQRIIVYTGANHTYDFLLLARQKGSGFKVIF